ncbi:MAG: DUF502 domain-containing protein [candidate division Zixibacteria bacterium]|nr:DUF502 domain-containing protein [candidate division Zixibacteria bacterium]
MSVGTIIRKRLLTGVLIVVPIFVTMVALEFIYNILNGIISPYIDQLIGYHIPGLGILALVFFIYVIGLIGSSIFAQQLIALTEKVLAKIPLAKSFYFGTKQLIEAAQAPTSGAFQKVVIVDFPKHGSSAIGFVTAQLTGEQSESLGGGKINVFVPTSPNPTSGFMLILNEGEYKETNLTVEEGMKMIVSGGILLPPKLK